MGIETDLKWFAYGLNCFCWDPDFTPDTLYVYVSGIKAGDAWAPHFGPPPNGGYALTQTGVPCRWDHTSDRQPDAFQTFFTHTNLQIGALIVFAFLSSPPSSCVFYFENELQDPTKPFYGGHAVVFQREPSTSGAPSIADILELLNMDGRESRKSEAFPLDSDHLVALIADQVESTRIRIKYDFS